MRALILANGDPPSAGLAKRLAMQHDIVMATDGAAHTAIALGLTPSIVCGDFDSVDLEAARLELPMAEFVETPDQNLADLEKALLLARDRGATEITLLGVTGGRIDHTLTAIALLLRYHRELSIVLRQDGSAVWAISGSNDHDAAVQVATRPGDTISLIAFAPDNLISLTGVKWPLSEARLPIGTAGVSNIAIGDLVELTIGGGQVVLCHLFDANASAE